MSAPAVAPPARFPLSGDGWALHRTPLRPTGSTALPALGDGTHVRDVAVPGNIQAQLGFTDLWLDTPELTSLNHDEWTHVRSFPTPPGLGGGARAVLAFDGVDYFCDVWVNGVHVGGHEGCFTTFELDVTAALHPAEGAANEVAIAVSCPWRVDDRAFYLTPSTVFSVILKHSEYMKGNLLHYWDGLPLSGYAVFPFGIWRDVVLEVRPAPVLADVAVHTRSIGGEGAPARVEVACRWRSAEASPVTVEIDLEVAGETFAAPPAVHRVTATVAPGVSETVHALEIPEPRLWWTWDTGAQDLYRLEVRTADGTALGETVFGVREVRRDDGTMVYTVNGRRLFLRGVWYPFANIFSALPTEAEHRRDVEMLRECGCNHLVSFTFVEKPAFYDACDRLGLLVMQELPYQQLGPMKAVDPSHPRYREFHDWSLEQVENIVGQLRGHASVVVWGAFAETRKQGRWVWGDYTAYNDSLRAIVERGDPDAVYHPSFCDFNEEHIWNGGFPFGEFWDHAERDHAFLSEFGAIAPPVVETLREIIPAEALWDQPERAAGRLQLPLDVEEYSYRWAFDYAGFATSVARMYRWADRHPPTLERFVDAVQWYQALGLRYCAESYRRRRFASFAGCRTWSYRENVPGIKFTVVDHRQRPKMGYHGLAAGYAPLLLSFDDRYPLAPHAAGSTWACDLHVVNDRPAPEALAVEVAAYGPDGGVVARQTADVAVAGDDGTIACRVEVPLPEGVGAVLVRAVATRADGTVAATKDHWLRVTAPAFAPGLRVLLLGQARYNAPILEALDGVGGLDLTVVDETVRVPQDSTWAERLTERYDVIWFAGWDSAVHFFRRAEWQAIADAVAAGVGLVHTGGQASFHGGDGRGAQLDVTPLGPVLPVDLQPHDGVWDVVPPVVRQEGSSLAPHLDGLKVLGFSRTTARPGSTVHWTIGRWPLLVTGTHGAGRVAAFTGYLVKPLRMFRIGEGLDWEDPLDVEPHWARADIRAYGPYWPGTLGLALDLLAEAAGRPLPRTAEAIAEDVRQPLYEHLAGLPRTTLAAHLADVVHDAAAGVTRGRVVVENAGGAVARLVRATVLTGATRDHRLRDGFLDLLPGERASLRFEAACPPAAIEGVEVRGQNTADVRAVAP